MRASRRWCLATSSAYRSRASARSPAAWSALTAEAAAASASRAATRAGDVPDMEYAAGLPAFTAAAGPGLESFIIERALRYADGIVSGRPDRPAQGLRVRVRPPPLRLGGLGL